MASRARLGVAVSWCGWSICAAVGALLLVEVEAADARTTYRANAADVDDDHQTVFDIGSEAITESSSLVVSTTHAGLVYTTNDSGDAATVYVLEDEQGRLVGRTTLAGVEPVDIEAMAAGSDGSLIVGDIGDNESERSSVTVYRIEQPGRGTTQATADQVELRFTGGPRDAEGLLYDAEAGRVLVISKELAGSVYQTPRDVFDTRRARLRRVAGAPGLATDATFLPGGDLVVVRTYIDASIYRYPSWELVDTIGLPSQEQGETVAAPPGGRSIWVGSEGEDSEVVAVRLPPIPAADGEQGPGATAPTAPGPTTDGSRSDRAGDDGLREVAEVALVGAGSALAVVVLIGIWRFRRHRASVY